MTESPGTIAATVLPIALLVVAGQLVKPGLERVRVPPMAVPLLRRRYPPAPDVLR